MAGGLMQLVAYGAQDVYLTGNPQITFFKVVYRRHTNFASESIQQTFSGTANWSRKVSCQVQRNGDLITKAYLQVILPAVDVTAWAGAKFAWCPKVGHALISSVELFIGGTSIDKQYGDWLNIWYELARKFQQDRGYDQLIGNTEHLTTLASTHDSAVLYVPLQFFFNRHDGLALPLIALQYHDVRIDIEFNDVNRCIVQNNILKSSNFSTNTLAFSDASMFIDYIYLDNEERKRFAQATHEYLIEQIQFTGAESVNNVNNKYRLNYNHPCKELIWAVQLANYNDGSTFLAWDAKSSTNMQIQATKRFVLKYAAYAAGAPLQLTASEDQSVTPAVVGNAYFTSIWDRLKPYYTSPDPLVANIIVSDFLTLEELSRPVSYWTDLFTSSNLLTDESEGHPDYDVVVYAPDRYGAYLDGTVNPVTSVLIQLNGHDRFTQRDGNYFNYVQPWQCHTNTPIDGVNVYSFALNPEDHQPSGTCNMSRIDNAQLSITVQGGVVPSSSQDSAHSTYQNRYILSTSIVNIYAFNYNVLRIMSGMGGLAYSN